MGGGGERRLVVTALRGSLKTRLSEGTTFGLGAAGESEEPHP